MRRLICMLTAVLLLASGVPAFAEGTREETAEAQLIRDMVLYYGCHGEAADDEIGALLGALKDLDTDRGELWEGIMAYWRYADTELTLHTDKLPEGLPGDDSLALVILGGALNPDGSMREELLSRLQLGLACAAQYPNARVICTGGGTAKENKAVTEAGQMGAWLTAHGLEEERLILEEESLSTIENAQKTLARLQSESPELTALALITSDYHVARACLLFEAVARMEGQGQHVVSNCASPAPNKEYTPEYLRGWQMYNMLQLIGEEELAWQYLHAPELFPRPALTGLEEAA